MASSELARVLTAIALTGAIAMVGNYRILALTTTISKRESG
jgi:hypothetical protein